MTQVSRPMQIVLAGVVLFAGVWFVALRPKSSDGAGSSPAAAVHAAPTAPGVKGLTSAIHKAHGAVDTANAAAQRSSGGAAAPAAAPAHPHAATAGHAAAPAHVHRHAATRAHVHHRAATHAHARHHAAAHVHARHSAAARAHARRRAAAHARARHHAAVVAHRVAVAVARRVAAVRAALRHHRAIAIAFVDPAAADSRAVAVEMAHVGRFHGRALTLSVALASLSSFGMITTGVQVTTAPTTVIVAPDGTASTIVGFADRFEIEQRLADALTKHHR